MLHPEIIDPNDYTSIEDSETDSQDAQLFPSDPKFENPLTGVYDHPNYYKFGFAFGTEVLKTEGLKFNPINGDIRKIHLYHNFDGTLLGLRFFDADGKCIYESARMDAFTSSNYKPDEIILNEGARIVGI